MRGYSSPATAMRHAQSAGSRGTRHERDDAVLPVLHVGDGVVGAVDRAADPPRVGAAHTRNVELIEHGPYAAAGEVGGPLPDLDLDDAGSAAAVTVHRTP